jgi:hypothetical protein
MNYNGITGVTMNVLASEGNAVAVFEIESAHEFIPRSACVS